MFSVRVNEQNSGDNLHGKDCCFSSRSVSTKNDLVRDISLQLPLSSSNGDLASLLCHLRYKKSPFSSRLDESFPSSSFSLENCLWRYENCIERRKKNPFEFVRFEDLHIPKH